MEEYYLIAQKMSWGDDDLQQELILSVINSIGVRKILDQGLIINRMVLQRKMYRVGYLFADRFGKSIDNGCAKRKEEVTLIPYDSGETDTCQSARHPDFAVYFTDYRNPEETALFNVGYERFLNDLTVEERGFWDVKLEGGTWIDIERLKIAGRNDQPAIRRSIREKFRKWFEK
ncbi:MAG: hypothetical protein A3F84_18405 [Candidatus Handelsmanbacteria bacterium RIFCSPLOWO2_12_FULL_64_10]|uniref:Uncharacterized protein n=1 Tax=Handelsmanbacteria sp. (strain RIFCSPLOWO2_12_FULL_64_10) TaxID=1817868 RepID=A0A1F6C9K3_HANXR|nr:MAG: hypothetical protein A3F84_18405 [Candidatus Handelsmanbacteria bacterium RIFCSPLOWO2_12_FULL_64_10]